MITTKTRYFILVFTPIGNPPRVDSTCALLYRRIAIDPSHLFRVILSIEVNQRSLCLHPINQLQLLWTVSEVLDLRCEI